MKTLALLFSVSALILLIGLSLSFVWLADVSGLFVVHFDVFRGVNFLGSRYDVYGILGLGLVMSVGNFLLAGSLFSRDRFLSVILGISSILISVLLFIGVSVILSHI